MTVAEWVGVLGGIAGIVGGIAGVGAWFRAGTANRHAGAAVEEAQTANVLAKDAIQEARASNVIAERANQFSETTASLSVAQVEDLKTARLAFDRSVYRVYKWLQKSSGSRAPVVRMRIINEGRAVARETQCHARFNDGELHDVYIAPRLASEEEREIYVGPEEGWSMPIAHTRVEVIVSYRDDRGPDRHSVRTCFTIQASDYGDNQELEDVDCPEIP